MVAVGLEDGRVVLHNVLTDDTLCVFQHDAAICSLAFRTDGTAWLLSGDAAGCVAAWDLDRRRVHCMNDTAHNMPVTTMVSSTELPHCGNKCTNAPDLVVVCRAVQCCLANQPVLLTGSPDNSLKMWVFDGIAGGAPRLLRERTGHSAPPTCVRFCDDSQGKLLVSGGLDSTVRATNITVDRQSREMSQRNAAKKRKFSYGVNDGGRLAPLRGTAVSQAMHNKWANVLTCHDGDSLAYMWYYGRKVIGEHRCGTSDDSPVMSVEISACGNFGFVGSARGRVDKYNMQSGLHRGTFAEPHTGAVHGLASDLTNQLLVSGSFDGTVHLYEFDSRKLRAKLTINSPVTMIQLQRDNGLLAVASDDLALRLFDTECPGTTLVRLFSGHTNRISDICFSSDGRWLLSAAMDSTVRVWDIPQGRCIDWFGVKKPVTSLCLSPTLNFLATTHVDEVGVFLWANKMQFSNVLLHPPAKQPTVADMPALVPDEATESPDAAATEQSASDELVLRMSTVEQLSPELTTLSSLPRSQWTMLSKLDVVKQRNKPKAPPKKPELAPFFLTQSWDVSNLSKGAKFVPVENKDGEEASVQGSREISADTIETAETMLCRSLREAVGTSAEATSVDKAAALAVIVKLKTLNPSRVDFELRSLGDDESGELLRAMLQVFRSALEVSYQCPFACECAVL